MMVERKLFTTLCNHVATFLYEVTASSTEVRQATAKRERYATMAHWLYLREQYNVLL